MSFLSAKFHQSHGEGRSLTVPLVEEQFFLIKAYSVIIQIILILKSLLFLNNQENRWVSLKAGEFKLVSAWLSRELIVES